MTVNGNQTRPAIELGFLDYEDVELLSYALAAVNVLPEDDWRRRALAAHIDYRLALADRPEKEPA